MISVNNKNVSANRLREIANEIEGKVKETENYISQIQKDANTVITVCKEMESYDGKGVEGSLNHTTGKMNENGETPWTYSWSIWNIKGASEKKSEVAELNRKVANVKVVLMNLGRLARKMQGSADDISLYQSLIEGLNWKENDPIFSDTFGLLAGHIAWDEYSAAAGRFEKVDPNNVQWWTDKPLRFTRNETTGAYLIEQQDSDGNWVGMGFTDETGYLNYIKAFNGKAKEKQNKDIKNLADKFKKTPIGAAVASSLFNAVSKSTKNVDVSAITNDDSVINSDSARKEQMSAMDNTNRHYSTDNSKSSSESSHLSGDFGDDDSIDNSQQSKENVVRSSKRDTKKEKINVESSNTEHSKTYTFDSEDDKFVPEIEVKTSKGQTFKNASAMPDTIAVTNSGGEKFYYIDSDKNGNNVISDTSGTILATDTSGESIKYVDSSDNGNITVTYDNGSKTTYFKDGSTVEQQF